MLAPNKHDLFYFSCKVRGNNHRCKRCDHENGFKFTLCTSQTCSVNYSGETVGRSDEIQSFAYLKVVVVRCLVGLLLSLSPVYNGRRWPTLCHQLQAKHVISCEPVERYKSKPHICIVSPKNQPNSVDEPRFDIYHGWILGLSFHVCGGNRVHPSTHYRRTCLKQDCLIQ